MKHIQGISSSTVYSRDEEFQCENVAAVNSVLNICHNSSADAGIGAVVNNFTVINVQQLNVNIVNKNINYYDNHGCEPATISEYLDDDEKNDRTTTGCCRRDMATRLLQKTYWDRWRDYAAKSKASRARGGTNDKVDMFLSKIQERLDDDNRRRKNKTPGDSNKQTCALNYCTAPTKRTGNIDRQQAKIDDQKKLLEKQRKEIERLRLQQLKLESEKALLENQRLLQDLHTGGSERRAKIRIAPLVQQQSTAASPSDILNRMEVRALERRAKWEAIKERRRKAEQEEMRKKRELEEKCMRERMEQKRERLLEARENLRLRTIEECRRKAERLMLMENVRIADDLYRKLLIRRGLEAFRVNLNGAKWRAEEASNHYDKQIVSTCFNKWRFYINNSLNEKILSAEQFYKRKLMKTTFLGFYEV